MNTQEAFKLLTLASARDGRTVDIAVATVWADDLAGIDYQDAVAAATAHYRATSDWLMPVHVIKRVQGAKKAIGTSSPQVPEDCGHHRFLRDGTCMHCTTRAEWAVG